MGSPETGEVKPRGERWLELLGLGDLKGKPTGYFKDGREILAEEFDQLCGDHIAPMFEQLESLSPEKRERYIPPARKVFLQYFPSAEQDNVIYLPRRST